MNNMSWSQIINFLRSSIDLIAVWFILYYVISMFKTNMKTMQLFKGVLFILIVKLITSVLGLTTLNYLVDSIINSCYDYYLSTRNQNFIGKNGSDKDDNEKRDK